MHQREEKRVRRALLLGTRGGDVLEIKLQDGSLLKNRPVTSGHFAGELWGLAAHPNDSSLFATSGDDKVSVSRPDASASGSVRFVLFLQNALPLPA